MRNAVRCLVLPCICCSLGCVVYRDPPRRVVEVEAPPPDVQGPVIDGPGVEVIEVEPPPVERVYVYDVGYPPGCYFYNDYYWYGHYRYPHDVFINRYVTVNIREHRYVSVDENRRMGAQIERRQQITYQQAGGRQIARPGELAGPAGNRTAHQGQRPRPAAKPPVHQEHDKPKE